MELADTAGQLAMERFRAPDLTVQIKEDGSPVTDADREIERVLREQITQQRPEHAITGEEYGDSGESQWRWYLDPIDGTTSYVEGGENWKTLIALTRAGRLELAVIDAPASAARWWAVRDQGAFRDGERLRVSSTRSLSTATVADDWRHTLARGVSDHPLARIAARCGQVVPHRGHSFLALAGGEVDVAVGVGGLAWDYAPMMLIVEEAGGRFTDLSGQRRFDSGNALVSDGAVHDEALGVLDEYPVAARRGST
jgi:histidinol-phosphatase